MSVLRTPDERFASLPDYPFQPNYDTVGEGLRVHYLDEGPLGAPAVLMMHGQPSWSYLYRRMIPPVVSAGYRVLAPDLVGFGRSDKPADQSAYTYENHVAWMLEWLDRRELSNVVLFCQDWGGLIGLRLVAARPDLFAGVVAGNTGLPEGRGMSPAFQSWLDFSQNVPELPVGGVLQMGSGRTLTDAEVAAYDAPFPDETYKAGARAFPRLVPLTPEHASVAENKAAWAVLERFDKPFVTCFSDADPITAGGERVFQGRVPGAQGQPHRTIKGGGHFLQEDAPEELAAIVVELRGRV
ncbi:haloalkane dehalogenase [Sphingomonas lenta]|uniref:Haloalkane dehalogenase n=1 Tax=Sphingomonas lenta TaxID=1141887 RepID=A0A2A2SEY5_9SPHN|nr:haloalkane dehalogenase [Sphingomonas lenta]PAX07760.1 haloalkane dehalogenase [Sphingomonas lenta]